MFFKKGFVAIFAGKHLYWSLFNRVTGLICFPMNIAKYLRTASLSKI